MKRTPKFEIKNTVNDEFYFVLLATNGKVILTSETYKTRDGARNGIASVRLNSKRKGAFTKLRDKSGQFRFSLKAQNHKIIGQSEGYKTRLGRWTGIMSVKRNAPKAETIEY